MANCKKDNPISLLGLGNLLVKNIKFTSDRKAIQVFQMDNQSLVCDTGIDSTEYLGVSIVNNELVFTDAISGLTQDISYNVSDNPIIAISQGGVTLNIIGIDDISSGFSVPRMNVRYDSATNSVKFQI